MYSDWRDFIRSLYPVFEFLISFLYSSKFAFIEDGRIVLCTSFLILCSLEKEEKEEKEEKLLHQRSRS